MKILKRAAIFLFFSVGLIVLSGYIIFRVFPARALENAVSEAPYDAIIVPGVPFNGDSMSFMMNARVQWACYLFEKGLAKNIIFSGAAVYTPFCEAEVMAQYAAAWGVPQENIFMETRAEHSVENVHYSNLLARESGFQRIALATDPIQTLMVKRFCAKYHPRISLLPVAFRMLRNMPRAQPQIAVDQLQVKSFMPLPERVNFTDRMKGTLGWKIIRD